MKDTEKMTLTSALKVVSTSEKTTQKPLLEHVINGAKLQIYVYFPAVVLSRTTSG